MSVIEVICPYTVHIGRDEVYAADISDCNGIVLNLGSDIAAVPYMNGRCRAVRLRASESVRTVGVGQNSVACELPKEVIHRSLSNAVRRLCRLVSVRVITVGGCRRYSALRFYFRDKAVVRVAGVRDRIFFRACDG
ncbi:hypothetical protein SDC9_167906 [bioreactor metagenome]|uniref:Uncharacterized protein n=1 Tax=bioreactor metagenome TaxID=1076179 RepID=A0A645G109_9ZZZZ